MDSSSRVGGHRTRSVDTRLVAATNRNLQEDVEAGHFRTDLFYRLNVYPIEIPPLRERTQDIRPLTEHFLETGARRMKCPIPELPESELDRLLNYDWPGNVRELKNVVERTIINSRRGQVRLDLPDTPDALPTSAVEENGGVVPEVELRPLRA